MLQKNDKYEQACRVRSKIIKILNSEENSKREVPNQIAKSKAQTHQTNGQKLSYS